MPRRAPVARIAFAFCLLTGALVIPPGCSGGLGSLASDAVRAHQEAGAALGSVRADWNDVGAAVDLAASRTEMAVEGETAPDEATRVFLLRTIGDEPAWLTARRRPDGAIDLEVTVGRFGDREKERRLLEAVTRRLGELRGVDYAPAG